MLIADRAHLVPGKAESWEHPVQSNLVQNADSWTTRQWTAREGHPHIVRKTQGKLGHGETLAYLKHSRIRLFSLRYLYLVWHANASRSLCSDKCSWLLNKEVREVYRTHGIKRNMARCSRAHCRVTTDLITKGNADFEPSPWAGTTPMSHEL